MNRTLNVFLRGLSDLELNSETKKRSENERLANLEVLHCLKEAELRKLYLKLGYSSLFKYVVTELKYSEDAAYRRIQAMRLLKDIPEIEEKIASGSLSLTNASQIQKFFQAERSEQKPVDQDAKWELIERLENKPVREVQKELVNLNPSVAPTESSRFISDDNVELKIIISEELKQKLDQLKALMSHQNSNMNYQELLEILANQALQKLDPVQKSRRSVSGAHRERKISSPTKAASRYIPAKIKLRIWQKDQGQCRYKSPLTGKKCDSKHLIQIDHIKPFALGGDHQESNLRLLCAQHNQLRAKNTFNYK